MSFLLIMSFIIAILIVVIICAAVFVKMRNVSLPAKFNMISNYIRNGNPKSAIKLCKEIIAKKSGSLRCALFYGTRLFKSQARRTCT